MASRSCWRNGHRHKWQYPELPKDIFITWPTHFPPVPIPYGFKVCTVCGKQRTVTI